jgi:prepilin-type processing-associated H-X9-DG protein/prepilin-type N-terminal cleavage/methylation domain-containing protein
MCIQPPLTGSSRKTTIKGYGAFTLIEMLVVIGIIGFLAALLLTASSRSLQRARQIQCINNVRQLGQALHEYLTDKHRYPLFTERHTDAVMWQSKLQQYELSPNNTGGFSGWVQQGLWKCPSANRPNDAPINTLFLSYGYNWYGLGSLADTNPLGLGGHLIDASFSSSDGVKESEIINPSDMMAIGDGFIGSNGFIGEGGMLWRTTGVTDHLGSTKRALVRHQGRANVVFCDGHVESPTLQTLFEDTSDTALVRWNRDHQPHREKL